MAKRITINQLAVMVAKGFNDITNRMATKDDLALLEKRMTDKFELEVNRLDLRLDQMAPDFDVKDLKKRVTRIETHLGLEN